LVGHTVGSIPWCLFAHVASLEQLGFNALLQLMIGVPLEMVHGLLRISLLYLAGVLAGEMVRMWGCGGVLAHLTGQL
jgi:membrane associated rhomboid family serine protease